MISGYEHFFLLSSTNIFVYMIRFAWKRYVKTDTTVFSPGLEGQVRIGIGIGIGTALAFPLLATVVTAAPKLIIPIN
jgi:hypothetical protein